MLGEIRGEVRFKEPLSFHTSLRIGGPADIFVVPQDVEDIRHALMFAEREQLPVAVVGGGNNLVVRDRGIRGVVLKLEGCLGRAEYYGEEALAGAGVGLSALDEGGHPARALGPQESLGLPHERPRDPLAPDLGRDGESVDVAAPAVEAADDGADDAPVAERDQEAVAVLAPDEARERLGRVGGARDRPRARPQREHRAALVGPAASDREAGGRHPVA